MYRLRFLAAFLAILLILAAGCSRPAGDPAGGGQQAPGQSQSLPSTRQPEQDIPAGFLPATVTRVVDGDTVHLRPDGGREETVRLIGVNTPESTKEVEPYGREAAAYTKSRLEGRRVWLQKDVQERDHYGRLLAYVWLVPPAGANPPEEAVRTQMFNAELLLKGYAQVMTVPPNVRYADLFVRLQREAREKNLGLWALPKDKEPYYVGNKNSRKFHRPDCEYGRQTAPDNRVRFATRDEALDAGYEPCNVCKP